MFVAKIHEESVLVNLLNLILRVEELYKMQVFCTRVGLLASWEKPRKQTQTRWSADTVLTTDLGARVADGVPGALLPTTSEWVPRGALVGATVPAAAVPVRLSSGNIFLPWGRPLMFWFVMKTSCCHLVPSGR